MQHTVRKNLKEVFKPPTRRTQIIPSKLHEGFGHKMLDFPHSLLEVFVSHNLPFGL